MPSTVYVKEEKDSEITGASLSTSVGLSNIKKEETDVSVPSASLSSSVNISSLNRDGSRSAFTPYKPSTVLTNLQRGNVQTQTPAVLPERSFHQLAAQGELFVQNTSLSETFDPNQKDQHGLTPLMWACSYGQLSTVQKLLENGALISLVANAGENALILACAAGQSAIVKELISHGAALDCKDQDGNTALMHAVFRNNATCMQELLSAGADLTEVNEALETAYDISIRKRCKQAQVILEKHILNTMMLGVKKS